MANDSDRRGSPIPHDYHIHLARDADALALRALRLHGVVAQYAAQARQRGVQEIGISEHCHRFREFRPLMVHLIDQPGYPQIREWLGKEFRWGLDEYVEFVQQQARLAGLPVRLGLEVDFFPGTQARELLERVLAPYPWDYLLGSVHFLGNWGIDMDPQVGWPNTVAGIDAVWLKYWQVWAEAAGSGLFSSLAHPDLPKKFGRRWSAQAAPSCLQAVAAALQRAATTRTAIEINSAGLRKPAAELYPSPTILSLARRAGVGITLGSDAHQAEDVGRDLNLAVAAAQQAGYTAVCSYRQRRVEVKRLDSNVRHAGM